MFTKFVVLLLLVLPVRFAAAEEVIVGGDTSFEGWVEPDFSEPTYDAVENDTDEVDAGAQESSVASVQSWQYLKVQTVLPQTQATSRAWFQAKILREIAEEAEASRLPANSYQVQEN